MVNSNEGIKKNKIEKETVKQHRNKRKGETGQVKGRMEERGRKERDQMEQRTIGNNMSG